MAASNAQDGDETGQLSEKFTLFKRLIGRESKILPALTQNLVDLALKLELLPGTKIPFPAEGMFTPGV